MQSTEPPEERTQNTGVLLDVRDLTKSFVTTRGGKKHRVDAVGGVSFSLAQGQTLGLVGESGCGKTTTARIVLRLISPTSGEVFFEGQDILKLHRKEMRAIRQKIQMVFQNPYASLNPRMRILEAVKAPLDVFHYGTEAQKINRVKEVFSLLSLDEAYLWRYPHEFSGGQRQRIAIARALVSNPSLLICDEPVSALDVSVRAQVLNLLRDIQQRLSLSCLFISHDLSVVRHICDNVAVMYLGKIVESAPTEQVFSSPAHAYTRALLAAIPRLE